MRTTNFGHTEVYQAFDLLYRFGKRSFYLFGFGFGFVICTLYVRLFRLWLGDTLSYQNNTHNTILGPPQQRALDHILRYTIGIHF